MTTRTLLRPPAGRVALLVVAILASGGSGAGSAGAAPTLGHPGYLVLVGAADTTASYRWHRGPGPGARSLVWAAGVLTVPADVPCEAFGAEDLAVPVSADLAGVGEEGDLIFRNGRYDISSPLCLGDGRIGLYVSAGELELLDERVRYTPPPARGRTRDPRAGFLLLAGMTLLIVVLLRITRRPRAAVTGS